MKQKSHRTFLGSESDTELLDVLSGSTPAWARNDITGSWPPLLCYNPKVFVHKIIAESISTLLREVQLVIPVQILFTLLFLPNKLNSIHLPANFQNVPSIDKFILNFQWACSPFLLHILCKFNKHTSYSIIPGNENIE